MSNTHTATISLRDLIYTLPWLSDRGYDGGIYDMLEVLEGPTAEDEGDLDDDVIVTWTSFDALEVQQAFQDDPDGFLSCNGSPTISDLAVSILNCD